MAKILLFFLILLLPLTSNAAYKIYLKNGSSISGVSSYERRDEEVLVYIGGGSVGIAGTEILKIEESDTPEKDFHVKEIPGEREDASSATTAVTETNDKTARVDALRSQLEAIDSEIRAVEEDEARVVKAMNDRRGVRLKYNTLQFRKLESDLEPLQQELYAILQRKGALLQRKADMEGELRALDQK